MATINLIDIDITAKENNSHFIEESKSIFKEFPLVDYRKLSRDSINYLPLHIRQPFDVESIIKQIPNDVFLMMQQGIIRPLIVMFTEHWDLFDTYAWHKNKYNLTPDFGNVPYSKMIQHFTNRSVPEENITWIVPMDLHLKQIQFLRAKGYKIKTKFIQYDYFLEQMKPFAKKTNITGRKFTKHFSCLCRGRQKNHRFGIVYEIWREGLLDKGNVSCEPYVELHETKQSNWIDDTLSTSTFMSKFKDWDTNKDTFKKHLPLDFDLNAKLLVAPEITKDQSKIFYDSFLWISSETKKQHDGVYITEKTWKAIAHGSPFCINGDNGSLDYLHQQGYKTFADFWDESYDNENDVEKIKRISGIVKNICSMNIREINVLYEKMIPILEHNRQTLINNAQHSNLIKELSNV